MLQFQYEKITIYDYLFDLIAREFAHVYFGPVQFERLLDRNTLGYVSIEFFMILVPDDWIQFVLLQLKLANQLGHIALHDVKRHDDVLHRQAVNFWKSFSVFRTWFVISNVVNMIHCVYRHDLWIVGTVFFKLVRRWLMTERTYAHLHIRKIALKFKKYRTNVNKRVRRKNVKEKSAVYIWCSDFNML